MSKKDKKKYKDDKREFLLRREKAMNFVNEDDVIPYELRKNLLAEYSSRKFGLADYAVNMTNAVTNGDFVNTTGWSATSAVISASGNTLSITGNGAGQYPTAYQNTSLTLVVGAKYRVSAKVRVRSSGVTSMSLSLKNTTGTAVGNVAQISPVQDQWYTLTSIITNASTTGTLQTQLFATYADAATANGKVMEVQEAIVIDLSTPLGLSNEPTASEFSDMLTYKGKTFWNGTEPVVINPNDKYYWPDRTGAVMKDLTNAVTNGDASGGTTGFTGESVASFTAPSGKFLFTANALNGGIYQSIPTVVGRKYQAVAKVTATTTNAKLLFGTAETASNGSGVEQVLTVQFTATSTSHNLRVRDASSSGWTQVTADELMVIDLSTPFGAGSEPSADRFNAMLTKAGTTFWNGTRSIDTHFDSHLHLVNLAYDATGGLQAGPPANYLFDGVNDYAVYNSATNIVAANGAVSAFVVFQAKGVISATHRVLFIGDATANKKSLALWINPTSVVSLADDSVSGTSLPVKAETLTADTWVSQYGQYQPTTKKSGVLKIGSSLLEGAALTDGTAATKRIVLAGGILQDGWSNDRIAEVYLFNKVLTQAEIKQLHNNIASRYGLTKYRRNYVLHHMQQNDIPELAETTRISVDGTMVILDDVQFNQLGIEEIECQMLSQKKTLALMETSQWKIEEPVQ